MSNYKFKLSDMIPNAWFYKLKDIGKGRNQTTTTTTHSKKKKQSSSKPHQFNPRKSYYFTRELNPNPNNSSIEPSRQSSKHKTRKRRTTSSSSSVSVSVSAGCSCRTKEQQHSSSPFQSSTTETESPDPEIRTDRVLIPTETSFDEMVSLSTSFDDIVINVDKNSLVRKDDKLEERYEYEYDDTFSKLQLAPIITKKKQHKHKKEEKQKQRSPGVKLRVNSPRIVTGRVKSYGKQKSGSSSGYQRDFSGSLAIVKSSFDPQKDFRESMVEMIVENNIRRSKDLEDLLACYLSLNSDEYHGVIIKVFQQIWFDLTQIS